MPIIVKTANLNVLSPSSVFLRNTQGFVNPEQGFVKRNGNWHPLWSEDNPDPGGNSNSPLPPGVARWGIAQFSDTDFTGGKTDPNADGQPYDRWTGVQDFIDSELQTTDPSLQVSMNIDFPRYGYFAHKASEGTAMFIDSVNGWPGGWDGATWEDGGFGSVFGPITVQYDDGTGVADWKVYRTDFSGVGNLSWTVTIQ